MKRHTLTALDKRNSVRQEPVRPTIPFRDRKKYNRKNKDWKREN
jgi:hypothetical protein